jgi:hypothetical protein
VGIEQQLVVDRLWGRVVLCRYPVQPDTAGEAPAEKIFSDCDCCWGICPVALPGYVAIALKMGNSVGSIFFDILLNFISWVLFGSIYLLSGNLWLTAFAHASTDYALLPAVMQSPILGLLFMGLVVTLAWRSGCLLNRGPVVPEVSALDTIDSLGA